jgi:Glycosyl hydrolase family 26
VSNYRELESRRRQRTWLLLNLGADRGRRSRSRLRLWMLVHVLVLGSLVYSVVAVVTPGLPAPPIVTSLRAESDQRIALTPAPARIPTKRELLHPTGKHFGVSTFKAPWAGAEIDRVARLSGAHPTMIEYFVKWTEPFRPGAVSLCYSQDALPVLSWEPWAGPEPGLDQPAYSLARIAAGRDDAYIARFARAIRAQRWPVVLRFAHEMNGNWYPWSEQRNGNRPGDYVRAWRHVHALFDRVGARNVIWVWSPNIIRAVPGVSLRALYPGDQWVDWVGVVGYGVGETTAAATFDPTLAVLRQVTRRPVLITETGAQPGPYKAAWTANLFQWLKAHHEVIGFIWFERNKAAGGRADWRFTADSRSLRAFKGGIARTKLARRP